MSATPPDDSGPTFGPRPTMPPASGVPDDRTRASTPPPAGPPWAGPPGPHRPANRRWWWLAAIGAFLLIASGGGLGGWGHGRMFGSSADQQRTYQADALELTGAAGDVRVVGGAAAGTVEVTRHLQWGMMHGQPSPNEQVNGGTLSINADCGGGFMSMCSIGYEVKVPNDAPVTIHVGSGDIDLAGPLGELNAETGSGNIDATGLAAANAVLRTGSGNLDLSFASAPTTVDLRTGSGDVTVFVPKGAAYAVDGTSGSGSRNITVDTSQSSSRKIHIETGSGDVELAYR